MNPSNFAHRCSMQCPIGEKTRSFMKDQQKTDSQPSPSFAQVSTKRPPFSEYRSGGSRKPRIPPSSLWMTCNAISADGRRYAYGLGRSTGPRERSFGWIGPREEIRVLEVLH